MSADLEAEMARLAEQVRQLAERIEHATEVEQLLRRANLPELPPLPAKRRSRDRGHLRAV